MSLTRWLPAALAGIVCSATVVSGQQRGTGAPAGTGCRRRDPRFAGRKELRHLPQRQDEDGRAIAAGPEPYRSPRSWGSLGEGSSQGAVGRNAAADRANAARTRRVGGIYVLPGTHAGREAAATKPNPGRAPVHRLNRAEYSNAIRDLLAVDVKPGAWLPVDDSGYGFDNIAAVLSTSPALLERYMTAARQHQPARRRRRHAEAGRRYLRRQARPDEGHAQRADQ